MDVVFSLAILLLFAVRRPSKDNENGNVLEQNKGTILLAIVVSALVTAGIFLVPIILLICV